VAIWCILWLLGLSFPVLVCCAKKNLATLVTPRRFTSRSIVLRQNKLSEKVNDRKKWRMCSACKEKQDCRTFFRLTVDCKPDG
jgi:hypothetical protein